jgi:hypothetical protein
MVQEYPSRGQRDLAVLSSLENVHVTITAYLFTRPTENGSTGMTCTVAEMRAPQWNNDAAVTQPLGRIRLRSDATVLDIIISTKEGYWNGNAILLNRGIRVDVDQYISGRFTNDDGRSIQPMSVRRIMSGMSVRTLFDAEPPTISDSLINQDPLAPTYTGEKLKDACAAFIYR